MKVDEIESPENLLYASPCKCVLDDSGLLVDARAWQADIEHRAFRSFPTGVGGIQTYFGTGVPRDQCLGSKGHDLVRLGYANVARG